MTDAATFRNISTEQRKKIKHFAGQGDSFPIEVPDDVAAAASSLGRTNQNRDTVKANIIRIAYELGAAFVAKLPDNWKRKSDQKASMSGTPATFTLEPTGRYEADGYAHYPNAVVLRAGEFTSGEGITVAWSPEDLHAIASTNSGPIPGDLEHIFARNPSIMTGNLSALRGTLGDLTDLRVAEDGDRLLGHITVPLLLDPKLPGKGVSVEVDPADPNTLVGYTLTTNPVIPEAALMSTLAAFAGARHSHGDQQAIQKAHDHIVTAGATCDPANLAALAASANPDYPSPAIQLKEKTRMSEKSLFARLGAAFNQAAAADDGDDGTTVVVQPPAPAPAPPPTPPQPTDREKALFAELAQTRAATFADRAMFEGRITKAQRDTLVDLHKQVATLANNVATFSGGEAPNPTKALEDFVGSLTADTRMDTEHLRALYSDTTVPTDPTPTNDAYAAGQAQGRAYMDRKHGAAPHNGK